MKCSIEGCDRKAGNGKLCWGHYCSKRRHGDVFYTSKENDLSRRFFDNIYYCENGCWYWTGCIFRVNLPYERIRVNNTQQTAHRTSWVLHNGKIPKGLLVLHKCDNPMCVNPAHLYLGTHTDNAGDRVRRNRGNPPKGESVKNSKLKNEEVISIFNDSRPYPQIAHDFHVSISNVCLIKQRAIWKHIDMPEVRSER